jgi:hypothetical protein
MTARRPCPGRARLVLRCGVVSLLSGLACCGGQAGVPHERVLSDGRAVGVLHCDVDESDGKLIWFVTYQTKLDAKSTEVTREIEAVARGLEVEAERLGVAALHVSARDQRRRLTWVTSWPRLVASTETGETFVRCEAGGWAPMGGCKTKTGTPPSGNAVAAARNALCPGW